MQDIKLGSYLRIAWWMWLCLMVLTIIGAMMWLQGANTEPALVIIGAFIAFLAEGIGFFRAWQDRQERLQDKAEIISAIRAEKRSIPVQSDELLTLDEVDFKTLQRLWQHISWEYIHTLLQGFADGSVHFDSISNIDEYISLRMNPKNDVYDNELNAKLLEFDMALAKVMNKGSYIFAPLHGPQAIYVPLHKLQSYGSKDTHSNLKKFKDFIKKDVQPTSKIYSELIDLLKKRRIYHRLVN